MGKPFPLTKGQHGAGRHFSFDIFEGKKEKKKRKEVQPRAKKRGRNGFVLNIGLVHVSIKAGGGKKKKEDVQKNQRPL